MKGVFQMIKKTVKYIDFNGNEREEDFYFHLSKAEIAEMELSVEGGLTAMIDNVIKAKDTPQLSKIFKELLEKSYGEKSADGRRFIKNRAVLDRFVQTPAYSEIYMELATNDVAAKEFFEGVIPTELK